MTDIIEFLNLHKNVNFMFLILKKIYPSIASGTIYKTLDTLVENKIIKRVKTDSDVMRYDANMKRHHHLYDNETKEIVDYYDDELSDYLENY